jgi:hypothetical protein
VTVACTTGTVIDMDSTQEILDGDPQLRQLSKSGHFTQISTAFDSGPIRSIRQ